MLLCVLLWLLCVVVCCCVLLWLLWLLCVVVCCCGCGCDCGCGCGGGGCGADKCFMCMSVHTHARMQLIKTGWCQRTSPFNWTVQPAKALRLFPPKAGSRRPRLQNSPNPKSRKKIARFTDLTPHSFGGRGAQSFSIASALSAPGPEC